MIRKIGLLMLAIVTACGGASEPKAPTVARVSLKASNVIVFGGKRIPLAAILTAYDASGAVIPVSQITVQLPTGWARSNDTIIAPQFESRGALRVMTGASAVRTATGPAFDVLPSPDTAVLSSIYDLRTRHWSATWGCISSGSRWGNLQGHMGFLENGVYVDSATYTATVDTVIYPADTASWQTPSLTALALLPYHAQERRVYWDSLGTVRGVDTVSITGRVGIYNQLPDSIFFIDPSTQSGSGHGFTVRTNPGVSPRQYRGGTWCPLSILTADGFGSEIPVVFTERP